MCVRGRHETTSGPDGVHCIVQCWGATFIIFYIEGHNSNIVSRKSSKGACPCARTWLSLLAEFSPNLQTCHLQGWLITSFWTNRSGACIGIRWLPGKQPSQLTLSTPEHALKLNASCVYITTASRTLWSATAQGRVLRHQPGAMAALSPRITLHLSRAPARSPQPTSHALKPWLDSMLALCAGWHHSYERRYTHPLSVLTWQLVVCQIVAK